MSAICYSLWCEISHWSHMVLFLFPEWMIETLRHNKWQITNNYQWMANTLDYAQTFVLLHQYLHGIEPFFRHSCKEKHIHLNVWKHQVIKGIQMVHLERKLMFAHAIFSALKQLSSHTEIHRNLQVVWNLDWQSVFYFQILIFRIPWAGKDRHFMWSTKVFDGEIFRNVVIGTFE